jgi:flotillin
MSPELLIGIPAGVVGLLLCFIIIVRNYLHICKPNEILIFSGRKRKTAGGDVGFRVETGHGWRMPIVETVDHMDVSLISVPMKVQGAYSKGGIPLIVQGIANIKVSSEPRLRGNAIERFLGRGRGEIARVAKETLEGHLRGVLATMTPEQVNEDRLEFAKRLSDEADPDLEKLGLDLDTLKVQHVADERNYLESIGRKQLAEILRDAEVAEAEAERSAREAEAASRARADVAMTNARATVQQKENELRQIKAELEAKAKSEEERAEQHALEARAQAEKELQAIRGELEQLRLAADVTIPAEINRRVHELYAAGKAATIAADGEAMAKALESVAQAWGETGDNAMDMYVLQNLEEIFSSVVKAAGGMRVGEVNLVDAGDGKTLPAYASARPATVASLLDKVQETLGIDIHKVVTGEANNGVRALTGKQA